MARRKARPLPKGRRQCSEREYQGAPPADSARPMSTPSLSEKCPQDVRKTKGQKQPRSPSPGAGFSKRTKRRSSLQESRTLYEVAALTPSSRSVNRKRSREAENTAPETQTTSLNKRPRISAGLAIERPTIQEAPFYKKLSRINPIEYWQKEQTWPKEYFEPPNWFELHDYSELDEMSHLLARKRAPSLRRKRSESDYTAAGSSIAPSTPSDQKPREEKSAPYQTTRYKTLLETKGSFMRKYEGGIHEDSQRLCCTLLESDHEVPKDSLFNDDIFDQTCDMIDGRNEAKVIQDIARLLVPSAETLGLYNAKLRCLIESVNEGWNNAIPLTNPRPQPDYSVGFKRDAFTSDQLKKLEPFIGDFIGGDQSFFMATYYMYFPFLSCEAKCGAAALDIADRQNAHSMTLAVRAIVELFRLVKREQELHQQILAFSISHDSHSVRIYGHYPVIDGNQTTFYRHPIRQFVFTELQGKEKWITNKFTQSVYNIWMPTHLDGIRSVIDEIPSDIDFGVPPLPGGSGLSQGLESHRLSESITDVESVHGGPGEQTSIDDRDLTLETSFTEQGASKKPRKNARGGKR